MRAATRIAGGQDPYDLCATMGCLEPTGPQYVMPPVLAWLLQPLVGVDARLITVGAVLVLNASLVLFIDADQRLQRSEEHTSELQSPCNLVCRLLLEKKKSKRKYSRNSMLMCV